MKLSVVIADTNADANAFVVWRGFEESIRKAKAYGYDGIELALKRREEVDISFLKSLLDETGLTVSAISTGQVFSALGLYLTNPDEEKREEAISVITGLVELASEVGGTINLGRARGFYGNGQSKEEAEELFLSSLGSIAAVADRLGVVIVVEPVNRYEINFINNLDECAALLDKIGRKNIGMMPDSFHMNIEDANIAEALVRNARYVKYVHLADSNRHAPGDGHLDFETIFTALKSINYDGWIAAEILPLPSPDEAAMRAVKYLRNMVEKYR